MTEQAYRPWVPSPDAGKPESATICRHLIDTSVSRCADCLETKPRGWTGKAVPDPEIVPEWQELADRTAAPAGWTRARYAGTCPRCQGAYDTGEWITKPAGQWLCSACGTELEHRGSDDDSIVLAEGRPAAEKGRLLQPDWDRERE